MAHLFTYGMLQHESVQRSTFGRLLSGQADALVGFELSSFRVDDDAFVAASGKRDHANLRRTGDASHRVSGIVYEVSDAELASADAYEPEGYCRVEASLASGGTAWVYVAD